jgi:phosphoglycolate phosphatase
VTKPDAILFDLDGTLVDSLADIAAAANRVLAGLDQPTHRVEDYRAYVGQGVTRLVERALPVDRQDLVGAAEAAFRADYPQHLLVETKPYPGIKALLQTLVALKTPLAVCTNKPQAAAEAVVNGLFAAGTFAAIAGQRADVPRKPDPAMALQLAAELGAAPERVWYLGDTKTDMQTARSAGMLAVGVLWGFRPRAELEEHGAQRLLADPADLFGLLRVEPQGE